MSSNGRPFLGYSNWHWIAQNRRKNSKVENEQTVEESPESDEDEVIVEEPEPQVDAPDFSVLKESIEVASEVESLKSSSTSSSKKHRKHRRR